MTGRVETEGGRISPGRGGPELAAVTFGCVVIGVGMDVEVLCVVVVWLGVAWVCLIDLGFEKLDFGLNVVDFIVEVVDLVEERAETVVHGGHLICE